MSRARVPIAPLLLLIFLSGTAGLVYQVSWMRQLQPVLGGSIHAITAVLASFMAGLALGSTAISRVAARLMQPLAVYALLELFIGVWGLLSPNLLAAAGPLLEAGRIPMVFLLLLPPTLAMGATLPAMAGACRPADDGVGRMLGRLYGASSAGAVCGALTAGFLLLPALGLAGGCRLAAFLNLAAAAGAWWLHRRRGTTPIEAPGDTAGPPLSAAPRQLWTIQLAALLSGAAAMALEVAWSRNFALLFGSSVYAISLVLAAFIGGIALGSWLPSRYFDRWGASRVPAAVALGLAAALTALVAASGSLLPLVTLRLFWWTSGTPALTFPLQLLLAGLVMLPGTFCSGAAFPLMVRSLSGRGGRAPEQALGWLYGVNTAGAVAGTLVAGFLMLPALGIEKTSLAASLVLALAAAVLLPISRRRCPGTRTWSPAGPMSMPGSTVKSRPWARPGTRSGKAATAGGPGRRSSAIPRGRPRPPAWNSCGLWCEPGAS